MKIIFYKLGDILIEFDGISLTSKHTDEVIKLLKDAEVDKLHLFKFKRMNFATNTNTSEKSNTNVQDTIELTSVGQRDSFIKETKTSSSSPQASEYRNAATTQESVPKAVVNNKQQPAYTQIVAKEDCEKIYAHIMDANNAADPALVRKRLSERVAKVRRTSSFSRLATTIMS